MTGGRITDVRIGPCDVTAERLDAGILTPGLLDLQNNGAFGVDFADATPDQWAHVLARLATRGVTSVQPTVVTAPLDEIHAAMDGAVAAAAANRHEPVSRILGVHLEGPFISERRKGAHRRELMVDPAPADLDRLLDDPATRTMLRTLTLAPERPHALDAARRLTGQGVVVSVGHTDATAEQVRAAADAGARMTTHVFNAMRPLQHRDPGVPGAVLTDQRFFVGLIVDGLHVDPLVCRLVFAAAAGRVVAVSDSILTAGLPAGTTLDFAGLPVANDATGLGRRPDGTLAGAGIVLDEGVRRMVAAGLDPAVVLAAATETPARSLGRADLGRLRAGALADLVWWDDDLRPRRVWLGGREVALDPVAVG